MTVTLTMLRALAAAPCGLTTPELAALIPDPSSRVNALGIARILMLKQERRGRVEQMGSVRGQRTRESVLWWITEEGERYIAAASAREARQPAPPAPEYGFRITVDRVGADGPWHPGLDGATGRLCLMADRIREFRGWMITEHVAGGATFLITASAGSEDAALSQALSWLRAAFAGTAAGEAGLRLGETDGSDEAGACG